MQPQTSVKFEVFPFVKDNFSVLQISDGESRIGPTGLCKIYSRFEKFTFRVKWSANRLNTATPCPKKMTFHNQTSLHNIYKN